MKVYNRNCMESNFDEILRYGIKYLICFLFDKEIQKEVCEFCRRNELCLCYIQERPNGEYPVMERTLRNASGKEVTFFRMERPQLSFCSDGVHLFCAAKPEEKKDESFSFHTKIRFRLP